MIKRRIRYPAQGRNEDYKFGSGAATSVLGVASSGGGGGTTTESWLEQYFNFDFANDVLQLSRAMTIQGEMVYTDAYKPLADNATNLGGYSAASYPRKAEAAVITGAWEFRGSHEKMLHLVSPNVYGNEIVFTRETVGAGDTALGRIRWNNYNTNEPFVGLLGSTEGDNTNSALRLYTSKNNNYSEVARFNSDGFLGIGTITPSERLHVVGNGLFEGAVTAGGNVGGSGTFVSGFAGSNWLLNKADNHLTVDRITVRGRMDIYELVVNQIRATNGSLWVSDAMKVDSANAGDGFYRLFFDTDNGAKPITFAVNDIIRAQKFDGRNVIQVTGRVSYVDQAEGRVSLATAGFGDWNSSPGELDGLEFVRIGNTSVGDRQGALYLTSSDSNAPYMDVLDGVTTSSFAGKTKVRLGKLNGITDADLGTLSGYGLYAENAYLKGRIVAQSGFIAGITFDDSRLYTANWELNKDGSFYFGAGGEIEGGLITGVVQSQNWNGTVGSRFDLNSGQLYIGDAIRVLSDTSEIQVKNRDTGLNSFRIGDFNLTETDFAGGGLDTIIEGTILAPPASGTYTINKTVYLTHTGVFTTSSSNVSSTLIIGGSYSFSANLKVVLQSYMEIEIIPVLLSQRFLNKSGSMKLQLKNGSTVIWEQMVTSIPNDGVIPLLISTSFQAISATVQLIVIIAGEYQWQSPIGGITRIYNTQGIVQRYDSNSHVVLQPLANRLEFSTKGMQSIFSSSQYFRCDQNKTEGRGTQIFMSPDSTKRLRISNSGIEISTNGGFSWRAL